MDESCCVSLRDLAVSGDDLQGIGYTPGRRLGDTLETLLEEVMDGKLPNEPAALLARAAQLK